MSLTTTFVFSDLGSIVAPIDVTADVISYSITRGIINKSPTDRLARPSTLRLVMNNSSSNSQSEEGFYSKIDESVQLFNGVTATFTDGTYTRKHKFYVTEIVPTAGEYGTRQATITAKCWLVRLYGDKLSQIDIVEEYSGPEIIDYIIDTMSVGPASTEYQAGLENFTSALYDVSGDTTMASAAILNVLKSDLGYCFMMSESTNGEKFKYFNRGHFTEVLSGTEDVSFDGTMTDLSLGHFGSKMYNEVYATSHPAQTGTANSVLWETPEEIFIPAAGSTTIEVYYIHPTTGERCSASVIDTPVSGTDYTMYTGEDQAGSNQTGSLTVTVTEGSNSSSILLENGFEAGGYVWIQLKGTPLVFRQTGITMTGEPLFPYDQLTSGLWGVNTSINFNCPYWAGYHHLNRMANRIAEESKSGHEVRYLDFFPTKNATDLVKWLNNDFGASVKVNETIKDYATEFGDYFYLMGEEIYGLPGGHVKVRWYLQPGVGRLAGVGPVGSDATPGVDANGDPVFAESGYIYTGA